MFSGKARRDGKVIGLVAERLSVSKRLRAGPTACLRARYCAILAWCDLAPITFEDRTCDVTMLNE
jgi:hypothetical protein